MRSNDKNENLSETRRSGVFMATVFFAVAVIQFLLSWWYPNLVISATGAIFISVILMVLAIFSPQALAPLFKISRLMVTLITRTVTFILLTFAFYIIILPTRLILALLKIDFLHRSWDLNKESYWETVEDSHDISGSYYQQF